MAGGRNKYGAAKAKKLNNSHLVEYLEEKCFFDGGGMSGNFDEKFLVIASGFCSSFEF